MQTITVQTNHKTEVIRVTELLADMVTEVIDGLAFFNVPHTTAALILCEDDAELRDDLVEPQADPDESALLLGSVQLLTGALPR